MLLLSENFLALVTSILWHRPSAIGRQNLEVLILSCHCADIIVVLAMLLAVPITAVAVQAAQQRKQDVAPQCEDMFGDLLFTFNVAFYINSFVMRCMRCFLAKRPKLAAAMGLQILVGG